MESKLKGGNDTKDREGQFQDNAEVKTYKIGYFSVLNVMNSDLDVKK